jgi:hypothetical protein
MAVMSESETGNAYRNLVGATCSKGEVIAVYAVKVYATSEVYLYSFLTSVLGGAECSALLPVRFIPEERVSSTQLIVAWGEGGGREEDCAAGLDTRKEKNLLEHRRERGGWIL